MPLVILVRIFVTWNNILRLFSKLLYEKSVQKEAI